MRLLLAASIIAIVLPSSGSAQTNPGTQGRPGATDAKAVAEKGTAVIRGRIVAADTRRPILGASVTSVIPAARRGVRAATDRDGRFELKDLPAGSYRLHASSSGFVALDFKEDAEAGGGRDITVADGETFDKADFALPRGGVVTGRVVDEAGEALEGLQVQAFSVEYVAGAERLAPVTGATFKRTNDQGRYRLFGLPPGEYYVAASPGPFNGAGQNTDMTDGYRMAFFPGTPEAATAQRITVAAGRETPGVDFALAPSRTFEVSGIVVDAAGAPIRGAGLMLSPGSDVSVAVMARAAAAADGTFTFKNVPPGKYTLQSRTATNFGIAVVNVTTDANDVVLQARPSPTARGDIVIEGGLPTFKPQQVSIMARPADFSQSPAIGGGFPQDIKDDWTFELRDVWGPRLINVEAPAGWGLKALRMGGLDVTDKPIDFEMENVGRLQVVLSNRITNLSGTALADGQPAGGVPVIVFAVDAARWDFQSRFLRMGITDEQGHYEVAALPPGEYRVVALRQVKAGFGWQRPQFLEPLVADSVRVVLREGERANADVKVSMVR